MTMVNILSTPVVKVKNTQGQVDNVSRKREALRKNKKEMEVENTVKEKENAFNRLISRLDRDEERINELEEIAMEISQTEIQSGNKNEKNPMKT